MNETAARLRAQKAYSTDPDYLERMALAEEARDVRTAGKKAESTLGTQSQPQRKAAPVR